MREVLSTKERQLYLARCNLIITESGMAERTGPVKEKFLTAEAGKETLEQLLLLHQVSQVQTTSGGGGRLASLHRE